MRHEMFELPMLSTLGNGKWVRTIAVLTVLEMYLLDLQRSWWRPIEIDAN